jgi:hypothetical protein
VRFTDFVGTIQVDLTNGVNIHVLSDQRGVTETKYINASSQDVFIFIDDKELKFQVPTSLFQDQLASRISISHETNELFLKTLGTDAMKGEGGYVNLSMLDSVDLPPKSEKPKD